MAYQNVGTPRFYIDFIQDWISRGIFDPDIYTDNNTTMEGNPFDLDPTSPCVFTIDNDAGYFSVDLTKPISINEWQQINYQGVIGHNLVSCNKFDSEGAIIDEKIFTRWNAYNDNGDYHAIHGNMNGNDIINTMGSYNLTNSGGGSGFTYAHNDGFHLKECSAVGSETGQITRFTMQIIHDTADTKINSTFNMNCLTFGKFYNMPVSPDLDLSVTTEFDGYDTTTTLGGSTLTNVRYTGAPWWRDSEGNKIEPWSVGESNGVSKRNGRRVWSMKFSYLSDKDIFSSNYMSNTYLESGSGSGYDTDDDLVLDSNDNPIAFENTLENDDSFVAQVLNKVGNGQRFIFQPDNTNNNPDQFAICQLDQDSLQIKQVAYKVYDISLKIREVW